MRTENRVFTPAEKKANFNNIIKTTGAAGVVLAACGFGVVLRDAISPNKIKAETLWVHKRAGKAGLAFMAIAGVAKVIDMLA